MRRVFSVDGREQPTCGGGTNSPVVLHKLRAGLSPNVDASIGCATAPDGRSEDGLRTLFVQIHQKS